MKNQCTPNRIKQIRRLSLYLFLFLHTSAFSITYTWAPNNVACDNQNTDIWGCPQNWSPHGVPDTLDDVIIGADFFVGFDTSHTVTNFTISGNTALTSVGSLQDPNPNHSLTIIETATLDNPGNINVHLIIESGAVLTGNDNNGNIDIWQLTNKGLITITDSNLTLIGLAVDGWTDYINTGTINIINGSLIFQNIFLNIGTLNFSSDEEFSIFGSLFKFINNGTVTRDGGTGRMRIITDFTNNGTLDYATGTNIYSEHKFSQNGTLNIKNNDTLEVQGICHLNSDFLHNSTNTLIFQDSFFVNIPFVTHGYVETRGNVTGNESMIINDYWNWDNGDLDIPIIVNSSAQANFNPFPTSIISNLITIDGTVSQSADEIDLNPTGMIINNGSYSGGRISFADGSSFQNNGTFNFNSLGMTGENGSFINDGDFISTAGDIACSFQNNGSYLVENGFPNFTTSSVFINSGSIEGINKINFLGTFTQSGIISPDSTVFFQVLNLNKLDNSNGQIDIDIRSNTGLGTGHDRLRVQDEVAVLGGTLNIRIHNDFEPNIGNKYEVLLLDQGYTGTFDAVLYSHFMDNWKINYLPNSVEAEYVGVLPVNLSVFTGKQRKNTIQLSWITTNEQNNSGFEVQKSNTGQSWEQLDFIVGKGTTSEVQEYTYEDNNPFSGTNYYRLKQIDADGAFKYSKVIKIDFNNSQENLNVFPNPSKGRVYLQFESTSNSHVNVEITDQLGNKIWKNILTKEEINQGKAIDINEAGLYFITVKIGNEIFLERVLITK